MPSDREIPSRSHDSVMRVLFFVKKIKDSIIKYSQNCGMLYEIVRVEGPDKCLSVQNEWSSYCADMADFDR